MNVKLKMVSSEVGVLDFSDELPHNMEVATHIDKYEFKQLFFNELNLMP